MLKNKTYLFLLFLFIAILYLITPKECTKKQFWSSIDDLGYSLIKSCYTKYNIKKSIKEKLSKNQFIYNVAAKIKMTFFKDFAKERDLNYLPFNEYSESEYNDISIPQNIKGLTDLELIQISKNYKLKPNKEKKFLTWKRSHANNWNNKFIDTDLIKKK